VNSKYIKFLETFFFLPFDVVVLDTDMCQKMCRRVSNTSATEEYMHVCGELVACKHAKEGAHFFCLLFFFKQKCSLKHLCIFAYACYHNSILVWVRFSALIQTSPGPHPASSTMATRYLSLTTHSHLVARLKKEHSYISAPHLGLHGVF